MPPKCEIQSKDFISYFMKIYIIHTPKLTKLMVLYCFVYSISYLQTFSIYLENPSLFFELLKNIHKELYLQDLFHHENGIDLKIELDFKESL